MTTAPLFFFHCKDNPHRTICPCWSCACCLRSSPCLTYVLTQHSGGSVPRSTLAQTVFQVFLSSSLKMGVMLPFFQSPVISLNSHDFSNLIDSRLVTPSANSLRTPGCVSSGPLSYDHSGSTDGHELGFWLQWEGHCSTSPIFQIILSRALWRAVASAKTEAKSLLSTSAFSWSIVRVNNWFLKHISQVLIL